VDINSRKNERIPLDCALQIQPIQTAVSGTTHCSRESRARDLSESGMQLWSERPYPVQSRVLVSFECEETGETHITTRTAMVMWFKPVDINGCILGVRFETT
jgi:hypothetical protein